jgi:hypothetical protein
MRGIAVYWPMLLAYLALLKGLKDGGLKVIWSLVLGEDPPRVGFEPGALRAWFGGLSKECLENLGRVVGDAR